MLTAHDVLENTKMLVAKHQALSALRDKGRLAEYRIGCASMARQWTELLRNTPPSMPLSRAASARRIADAWHDAGAPEKVQHLAVLLTEKEIGDFNTNGAGASRVAETPLDASEIPF